MPELYHLRLSPCARIKIRLQFCDFLFLLLTRGHFITVVNVKDDVVQISLDKDENENQKALRWFRYATIYSSPDGTGWYFMPEIGDTIRLHVPGSEDSSSYVINSVHMEGSEDRKQPDVKSIKTKYGKEIRFTPESIEITNNSGMSIVISDQYGISITSDKNISITSNADMSISSNSSSVIIAGASDVSMKQNGASVTLNDNILLSGGEVRIH